MTAKYSKADEHLTLEKTPKAAGGMTYVNVSPSGGPVPLPRRGASGVQLQQRPDPIPKPRTKSKPGPPIAKKPQHLQKGSRHDQRKRATLNPRGKLL